MTLRWLRSQDTLAPCTLKWLAVAGGEDGVRQFLSEADAWRCMMPPEPCPARGCPKMPKRDPMLAKFLWNFCNLCLFSGDRSRSIDCLLLLRVPQLAEDSECR